MFTAILQHALLRRHLIEFFNGTRHLCEDTEAQSSMVEGEKLFDIAIRWPKRLRNNETSILDIPVDIINNTVVQSQGPGLNDKGQYPIRVALHM
jgi:hypothetical protein